MNEELLKQLVPIMEITKNGVIKAVDIIQEQAPILVKEILAWEFASSLITFLIGVILCLSFIPMVKNTSKWFREDDGDPTPRCVLSFIYWIIAPLIGIPCILFAWDWLKILIAPRLFLIEYVANLIKS